MEPNKEFSWPELYRPHTINDCILPDNIAGRIQQYVDAKELPNLLLYGPPGTGKTTVAKAMCDELDINYLVVNASLDRNIDTLRTNIARFASTRSMVKAGRKMVILDEGDYLNKESTQPALRGFMDEFSQNTGFIITCNFRHRIIEPLWSRCVNIDFTFDKAEKMNLMKRFMARVLDILKQENVKYSVPVVAEVIKNHYPDFRRVLNELQGYSAGGEIDSGILSVLSDALVSDLIPMLKEKDFRSMRKWVAEHIDTDSSVIYRKLYDNLDNVLQPYGIPEAIELINDGQVDDVIVADKEINLVATLSKIMREVKFK